MRYKHKNHIIIQVETKMKTKRGYLYCVIGEHSANLSQRLHTLKEAREYIDQRIKDKKGED